MPWEGWKSPEWQFLVSVVWEDMSISCRTHCICPPGAKHKCTERRDIPGSVAFVPSVVGLIMAGEVVRDIAENPDVIKKSKEIELKDDSIV